MTALNFDILGILMVLSDEEFIIDNYIRYTCTTLLKIIPNFETLDGVILLEGRKFWLTRRNCNILFGFS